jgi:hypothetical protein
MPSVEVDPTCVKLDVDHVPSVPLVSVHDDTAAISLRSHVRRTVEATMFAKPDPGRYRSVRNEHQKVLADVPDLSADDGI